MIKSRKKKATYNIATSLMSEVVAFVCNLILPRLIILTYGSAYNGITSSASQFLSLISILNLGVAGATRAALYKTLAADDIKATSAIVKATERHMRKIAFVLAGFIVILAIGYPLLIDTGYSFPEVALLILAVGINSFGNYFFGATYQALLSAAQCLYIVNLFTIVTSVLNTILAVILIKLGCSIQVVKLCSAGVFFLKPLLQKIYVDRKFRIDKHCKPDTSALEKRGSVMAHSIANIVHDNTDMIVLTAFCNVKIVSVYTVYNLVMNALKKTQTMFTNGTEAIFGDMWAKAEYNKAKESLNCYEIFIMLLITIIFSTAMVMIVPFIKIYTQGAADIEYVIPVYAIVITAAQAFYAFRSPYVSLVQGAGHYKETRNGAIAEASINMILSVVLVQFMGIIGVAIGTLAANIFRTIQYAFYVEKKMVQRGTLFVIKRIVWTVSITALLCVLLYFPASYASTGWMQWILCGACVFAINTVVSLGLARIFFIQDTKRLYALIKNTIKGKLNKGGKI